MEIGTSIVAFLIWLVVIGVDSLDWSLNKRERSPHQYRLLYYVTLLMLALSLGFVIHLKT